MRSRLVGVFLALLCGVALASQSQKDLELALVTARGEERVRLLNQLVETIRANAPHEAIVHAEQALALARELDDQPGQTDALNNLGVAHYFLGEYNTALGFYQRSLAIAERTGDEKRMANALNNIGVVYFVWGEYEDSLVNYSRAIAKREALGDQQGLANGYNNLGNVLYAAGRYEESLKHYGDALRLYEATGQEALAASTRNNIGLSLFKMERYEASLEEFGRALAIDERIGDRPDLARSLDHIGMVYGAWGRHEDALTYHRRALAVREELDERAGVTLSLLNLGLTYTELGDHGRARDHLDRALATATELNLREVQRDVYEALSESCRRTGDYEQALEYHRLHKQIHDDLFDERTGARLAELQARYDVERKDREIAQLQNQQEIQRVIRNAALVGAVLLLVVALLLTNAYRLKARANREIVEANAARQLVQEEREKATRAELAHVSRVATLGELAAALAHELRQPLTAILSNAQATRRLIAAGRADDTEIDEALGDIIEGSERSREIIRKLRDMLQRGEVTREPLDINETLRGVESFAAADARQHGIAMTMDLEPRLPSVSGDPIQLQQVLLNLIHNATEAMSNNGDGRDIVVRTSLPDPKTVLVSVRDSGSSVDQGVIDRMFDPFFTTKKDGLGMGLPISHSIIESHGGRMWVTRNAHRGLTVQFALPASSV